MVFQEEAALGALRHAQLAVATLVGAEPRDLVFLANATTAVNAVLQSTQASLTGGQRRRDAARPAPACDATAGQGCSRPRQLGLVCRCASPLLPLRPASLQPLSLFSFCPLGPAPAAGSRRPHPARLHHLPRRALRRRPRGGAARRSVAGGGSPRCAGRPPRGVPAPRGGRAASGWAGRQGQG